MLRPVPELFALCSVPISKYFTTLCWVWYSYHSYVGKVTWCRIFWWFYWSFSSSLGHSSCFFTQVRPPFYGSNCCPCIFRVSIIDCSCSCHSFPTRWSPYSSKCRNTCWDQHCFILDSVMRCLSHVTLICSFPGPTFWKPSNLVLSLVVGFFSRSLTRAWIYFSFSRCSFRYHVNTSPLMCELEGKCLVINLFYHTNILFIINLLSYNIMYASWLATSFNYPPFTVSIWSYHWWFKYPFVSMPL